MFSFRCVWTRPDRAGQEENMASVDANVVFALLGFVDHVCGAVGSFWEVFCLCLCAEDTAVR